MKTTMTILLFSALCMAAGGQMSIEEARLAGSGAKVTVTGVVLNGPELGPIRYIQDSTAAIAVYPGSGSVALDVSRGDMITVSGTNKVFSQLLEIDVLTSVEVLSSGNELPEPVEITPDQMNPDLEGQLVLFRDASFVNPPASFAGDANYTISYQGKQGEVRIYRDSPIAGTVIPTGPVNITGICSRFYETFQMLPRDLDDLVQTSPIFFTSAPKISELSQTGFRLDWETNISGSTEILYGNTPELEKGHVSAVSDSIEHSISLAADNPAELFYVMMFSVNGPDTAVTGPKVYITQSASSGDMKAYFNREVDNSVSTGVDALRVYRALDDTVIHYIDRAKETIDFTIYNYNLVEVSDITAALNAAHDRGVRVRVIHDGSANNSGFDNLNPEIGMMVSPVENYEQNIGIMHNKFIIFDADDSDPDVPVVWTGSTNFTDSQVNLDANSVIIVQDQSLARAYTLEFNEMFGSDGAQPDAGKARFGASKADNTPHEFIIGGRQVECWFSPSDNVHAKLKETLEMATTDISVATMLITKSDISYILRDKHDAGFAVRVLVNSKASCGPTVLEVLNSSLDGMFIESTESGIMHHKYMLIDRNGQEPVLWVGSHNWSTAADERNDENTLVVHDATMVNLYYQEFYKRFSASGGPVGLKAWKFDGSRFKIYPNPVGDELQIQFNGSGSIQAGVALYNMNGQRILSEESVLSPGINVMHLPSTIPGGIYILQIRTGQGVETFKLLVR